MSYGKERDMALHDVLRKEEVETFEAKQTSNHVQPKGLSIPRHNPQKVIGNRALHPVIEHKNMEPCINVNQDPRGREEKGAKCVADVTSRAFWVKHYKCAPEKKKIKQRLYNDYRMGGFSQRDCSMADSGIAACHVKFSDDGIYPPTSVIVPPAARSR